MNTLRCICEESHVLILNHYTVWGSEWVIRIDDTFKGSKAQKKKAIKIAKGNLKAVASTLRAEVAHKERLLQKARAIFGESADTTFASFKQDAELAIKTIEEFLK